LKQPVTGRNDNPLKEASEHLSRRVSLFVMLQAGGDGRGSTLKHGGHDDREKECCVPRLTLVPMLATPGATLPEGPLWMSEVKWDGLPRPGS